jgi:hypothetical protein
MVRCKQVCWQSTRSSSQHLHARSTHFFGGPIYTSWKQRPPPQAIACSPCLHTWPLPRTGAHISKASLALFTHFVCTPEAPACDAPSAARAPRHLHFSCHPCSRELLNLLQAQTKSAEYCNEECFSREGESTAGCVHPTQLTAVSTTPALARC